jgi:hypothetical protein
MTTINPEGGGYITVCGNEGCKWAGMWWLNRRDAERTLAAHAAKCRAGVGS